MDVKKAAIAVSLAAAGTLSLLLLIPETETLDFDTSSYGQVDTSGLPGHESRPEKVDPKAQFSAWDGSHTQLERVIKQNLNDPDTYEHLETKYVLTGAGVLIDTRFRASNKLGALVENNVVAQASLEGKGEDVSIVSWE